MEHKIFSIFDEKAKGFLPPFIFHNENMAKRIFADCVNDPNHQFGKHPEDYHLFEIGTFDDVLGRVKPHETIEFHGIGLNYLSPSEGSIPFLEEAPARLKNGQAQKEVSHG